MEYLYAKEYQTLGPKCYAFKLIGRQTGPAASQRASERWRCHVRGGLHYVLVGAILKVDGGFAVAGYLPAN